MAALDPVRQAEQLYRHLLRLYPNAHRQEYGVWMAQNFKDICLAAYRQHGPRGITRVWLKTIPDLTFSVVQEHEHEFRRWLVNKTKSQNNSAPRETMGFLVGAVLIALGLLLSVVIREAGGSPLAGAVAAAAFNLLGAIVLELSGNRSGAVFGAMVLVIVLSLLPLAWVADAESWLRENPLLGGILILTTSSMRSRLKSGWPLYAVALIMGGAQILISLV